LSYLLECIKENVYVFAVWDSEWNSYNNCYILLEKDHVTLIDSCKKNHIPYLELALGELGKSPDDVKLVLATHGHEDHVEGSSIFTKAKKVIHPKEKLDEFLGFVPVLSGKGEFQGIQYGFAGHHTPGSVIFFHQDTKTVFTGDFLCFFGDPLSKEGLVSKGDDLRKAWVDFLQDDGVPLSELTGFLRGLKTIQLYDADVMCTGHGGVLTGEIESFVKELLQVGELKIVSAERGF
jgi:glyoxylase-like metal-dependent hydrolase (beta-lactamase superfamily II)